MKPYKSEWDNVVAITLAANLLLTIVSGMAFRLYSTISDQDEYERNGFGAVLIVVSVLCILLSLGTTLASTPYFQHRVEAFMEARNKKKLVKKRSMRTETAPVKAIPGKASVEKPKGVTDGNTTTKSVEMVPQEKVLTSDISIDIEKDSSGPEASIESNKSEKTEDSAKKEPVVLAQNKDEVADLADLNGTFESISDEGILSIEACLSFLRLAKMDSESNVAMVKALDKELSHGDFASVCQRMQLGKAALERYEAAKVNKAIVQLRRLSAVDMIHREQED